MLDESHINMFITLIFWHKLGGRIPYLVSLLDLYLYIRLWLTSDIYTVIRICCIYPSLEAADFDKQ